ncbi:MAG: flagellar basal body L-ring protein FlgH [Pseudomonadota bacterium]
MIFRWIGLCCVLFLAGCNGQLDSIGRPPPISAPGAAKPTIDPPVPARMALRPQLPEQTDTRITGSLWRSGPKSLFGDRRAKSVGDILTVTIAIEDTAEFSNSTTRDRSGSDDVSVTAAFGLTNIADSVLSGSNTLDPAVSASGTQSSSGAGQISREEEVNLRLAATVVTVLPNGHLVIRGSQEVRVNFELRDLQIAGIVRPEDISRQNVITYDKIADARIAYGGRGQVTDLQQPRLGQQVVDLISPF